jgi:hypothetical protein
MRVREIHHTAKHSNVVLMFSLHLYSLEQMKVTLLQNDVKLLIVDSVAALTSS